MPTGTTWVLLLIISRKVYSNLSNWFWVLKAPPAHKSQINSLRTLLGLWLKTTEFKVRGSPSFVPLSYLRPSLLTSYFPSTYPILMSIGSLAIPQAYSIFFYLYAFAPVFPSAHDAILYPQITPLPAKGWDQYHLLCDILHEKPRTISLSLPIPTMLCLRLCSDTCKILSGICFFTSVS